MEIKNDHKYMYVLKCRVHVF